jgi:hypothetical protein
MSVYTVVWVFFLYFYVYLIRGSRRRHVVSPGYVFFLIIYALMTKMTYSTTSVATPAGDTRGQDFVTQMCREPRFFLINKH